MMLAVDIGVLEFLHSLADTADSLAGDAWLSGSVPVSAKPDGSPVTATDLAVESALRDLVRQRYPADGFLGEEVGRTVGVSDRNWVVDGIDGTAAFVAGRVLFGGEVWDHAACSAIVIAAGGRWSDIDGDEGVKGGPGVYTNGHVHDAVLATLRGDS